MREILPDVERWRAAGQPVALATVVRVWGSAPRRPGSKMAVSGDGEVAGSVSGGCVEGAVVEEARGVLAANAPKLLSFGVTDEQAWAVGLSCGGTIEVFVEPLATAETSARIHEALRRAIGEERLVARAVVLAGPSVGRQALLRPGGESLGGLGHPALDVGARAAADAAFARLAAERRTVELADGPAELFVEVHAPRPRLVVVGAVHVAVPLVRIAHTLGFRTCVVDPRSAFATRERFADADELIVDWPAQAFARIGWNEMTYVAVLTHDLKIDVPALELALRGPARYVGVLGSRRTHARRVAALREAGVGEEQIERIRAPIGLDIGATNPEEIALAIVAEIVAASHGLPAPRS